MWMLTQVPGLLSPQPDAVRHGVREDGAETRAEGSVAGGDEHDGEDDCPATSHRPVGECQLSRQGVALPAFHRPVSECRLPRPGVACPPLTDQLVSVGSLGKGWHAHLSQTSW